MSERPWLTPAIATVLVGFLSLLVPGIGVLVYIPVRDEIAALRRDATELQVRAARLEERINNLHAYVQHATPATKK